MFVVIGTTNGVSDYLYTETPNGDTISTYRTIEQAQADITLWKETFPNSVFAVMTLDQVRTTN